MSTLIAKLENIDRRYAEITDLLSNPEIITDQKLYVKLNKELREQEPIIEKYKQYKALLKSVTEAKSLVDEGADDELQSMAAEELEQNEPVLKQLEQDLQTMLLPKDPAEERDAIVEIRAGTGGEEAALFAADLFRMYARYIEEQNWRLEKLSGTTASAGGLKEIIFSVHGEGAYGKLWYESGVHRVQRVPATEASGRIHTSAASVVVLPEAAEVDLEVDPNDLRIDVFRSQGPGGQSVNTTDSAVRVTHIPSGLVVTCQDEKSQHKNKAKAMKVLRSRLLDLKRREEQAKIDADRRAMVSTGDRSAKIRTYNYPQGRVTDHRINFTSYRLQEILDGDIAEIIDHLRIAHQTERLNIAIAEAE